VRWRIASRFGTLFIQRKASYPSFAVPADLARYPVNVRREGDTDEAAVALSKPWAGRCANIADVNVDGPFGEVFVDSVADRTAQALVDPRTAGPVYKGCDRGKKARSDQR
jgi:hypothetical protein